MAFTDTLGERQFVSQYSIEAVGFVIHKNGIPADADADVNVKMLRLDDTTVFPDRVADHPAVGVYETTISSVESQTPGIFKIVFTYTLDAAPQTFVGLLEVGEASAAYDALSDGFKGIVESAWVRFADMFDSPDGGPHLQVYFQSRFGRGRMAQLLQIAMNRLNTISQPHTTYSLDPNAKAFPFAKWGGLLDQALYVEAIKHLIRSYVEQPDAPGVNVARLDRRDYVSRWATVLQLESEDLTKALEVFKIAHMGLGRPRVLASGGVYGTYGPTRIAGSAAARPRYWARFY